MKNTTRMTLRSALFTVFLSSSTMLAAADGGGETPGPAVTPPSPGPIDQRAPSDPLRDRVRLDDGQLDAVRGGLQIFLGPINIELFT